IVERRKKKKIETTDDLVQVVKPHCTWGRLHPATLVFQALRIAVNQELDQLKKGLEAAIKHLSPRGRLAVISFHSLEDRIAKHTLLHAKETMQILTKKPIVPTEEEMRKNPRSRSAKLRAAEKKII
ncbi:MAG: 16S rRNA (cytosine(1402)-N(4))-methyltransferase, partial [Chlamydiae bacterium]|nr:16S rRNA (cytosine(1402)-N(4))-methyltransferase [Chlamydiota bacterium]